MDSKAFSDVSELSELQELEPEEKEDSRVSVDLAPKPLRPQGN